MKRFLLILVVLGLALIGCDKKQDAPQSWADMTFSQIEEQAKGTTVTFYMYGGWAHTNQWVDTVVGGILKDRYNITLKRVPMDASAFVNKLVSEKQAGKAPGTIDLMWINGENFKNAREAGTLAGPFLEKLPNSLLIEPSTVAFDFGYPVDGYEAPYGKAIFVFEYDEERTTPPASFAELEAWVKAHPGQFTYPQPPDFTGSAFIRQAFYATTGGHEQYMAGFDETLYAQNAPKLWSYLNRLKPYLWRKGEVYPKDSASLDGLFSTGEVALNMSYHPVHAQNKILEGSYSPSIRTFLLNEGTLFNTHFVAIAENAPNIFGALVAANVIMSPEVQLSKNDPNNWGDFTVLDFARLSEAEQNKFSALALGEATLPLTELTARPVPEIPSSYLERLEKDWEQFVLKK